MVRGEREQNDFFFFFFCANINAADNYKVNFRNIRHILLVILSEFKQIN